MKVYRFQDIHGVGIYSYDADLNLAGEKLREQLWAAHNPSQWGNEDRPNLYNDFTQYQQQKVRNWSLLFACPSIETLKEWFEGFWEKFLKNKSIQLVEIDVESYNVEIGLTGLQCVFNEKNSDFKILKTI